MQKVIDFLTNPSQFLTLLYIASASGFVTFCFKKHTSFIEAAWNLLGSIVFGTLVGYLLLEIMGKWVKIITAICSMFGMIVYRKFEKTAPSQLLRSLTTKKNEDE